ncbi:peptidylprolyl isomerase [Alienimonas chondri]|uniref:Peptidyl-prolyl cis-trans isomerase n=1 Tax=Alienimonas chondri TaxID=2681879 RepID=A0ABX1V6R2_9PLAN|nr:peptidylprolyl isomerase [Alienimonas chondri]NNJ23982.1 Peptidyl-prolyl cis-trans isomerase B [Alienimonas chondri]
MAKNYKSDVEKHTADFDPAKQYRVTLNTTAGPIRLDLRSDKAPGHCKNMVGLAKVGFYDDCIFHRVIDGFMIQGGDPTGTGTGGPGYQIDAEFNDLPHEPGVLSMARSQDPNSAGSQFFICLPGDTSFLNNQYTAFGKVADEESMATVAKIGAVETNTGDRPLDEVKIEKASAEVVG